MRVPETKTEKTFTDHDEEQRRKLALLYPWLSYSGPTVLGGGYDPAKPLLTPRYGKTLLGQ